jgi:cell division septation protein DedD
MSYDFSFSTKSVILIVIGCVAIGVLLFVAGFIIGVDNGHSLPSIQASFSRQNPSEPKTRSEKDSTGSASESSAAPNPEQPSGAKAEKPANEKSKEAEATSGTLQEAKSSKDGEAKEEPKAEGKDKEKDKPAFSVQLGAFQTEDHALALRDKFKAKGYSVFLFRVLDADGHMWHTVRMGHYADMKEASHAAEKITNKEQISAWVRPADAF